MRYERHSPEAEFYDQETENDGNPSRCVKLLQEGQVMLAAGKSEAEVFQRLEITEFYMAAVEQASLVA